MENITLLPPLNLQRPNALVIGHAKQGDRLSRWYQAQLLAGDVAWTPPNNLSAAIRFLKPDGHGGWYDILEDEETPAVVLTGSTVKMGLAEQVLTCPGDVKIDLEFADASGSIFTAFTWTLRVEKNVIEDAIMEPSEDYFAILAGQVAQVQEAADTVVMIAGMVKGPFHLSSTISSFPHTVEDERIVADTQNMEMRVFDVQFSDPDLITSDVTWTTTAGEVEFDGTKKAGNVVVDFLVGYFDLGGWEPLPEQMAITDAQIDALFE